MPAKHKDNVYKIDVVNQLAVSRVCDMTGYGYDQKNYIMYGAHQSHHASSYEATAKLLILLHLHAVPSQPARLIDLMASPLID